jgi:hypothetical protein
MECRGNEGVGMVSAECLAERAEQAEVDCSSQLDLDCTLAWKLWLNTRADSYNTHKSTLHRQSRKVLVSSPGSSRVSL